MTDDERALVNAWNRFFSENGVDGIAHRKKQHRFSSQLVDILVDSAIDRFYLAIEAKSVKISSTNKLYFSQHFSSSKDGHQVTRISDFVDRSGRTGYLFVEMKRGRGRSRKAFMVPWQLVRELYENGEAGVSVDEVRENLELERDGSQYNIQPLVNQL